MGVGVWEGMEVSVYTYEHPHGSNMTMFCQRRSSLAVAYVCYFCDFSDCRSMMILDFSNIANQWGKKYNLWLLSLLCVVQFHWSVMLHKPHLPVAMSELLTDWHVFFNIWNDTRATNNVVILKVLNQ